MNHKKTAIWFLTLTVFSFALTAEEIDNKVDRAKFGLAQSLINTFDPEQAEPIIKKLYLKYPNNEDIVVQYILILSNQQQYDQAIDICRKYLKNNDQSEIKLWLARLLSWNKQYEQSVRLYCELTEEHPDKPVYIREKARVLGWDRKYDQAIREYRGLTAKYPDRPELFYEMQAKYSLYNQRNISGIKNYKRWIELEPQDAEALYDLAQIYSSQNRWTDARKMYELTLKEYSGHFRAKQALEKVKLYSQAARITTGFEYFEADSSGRTMDKRYWDVFTTLKKPINDNINLNLRQDNIWYNFNDFDQIYQQKFGLSLEYHRKPYFWGSANFSNSIYGREKGVKYLFGGEINFLPADEWTIMLSHQRQQIVDNSTVFLNKLYSDNYKARCVYKPYRRFAAGFDYMHSNYSDNNNKNTYGLDLGYYLSFEPASLKLTYRYEQYYFSREDIDYFSPDSFHYNKLGVEWKQFLNKEEMFWGANDTYYTIQYEIIFDVRQQIGHKTSIGFHHDWNNRCNSRMEWSKTIYEHSSTYSEDRLMFYTSLYF